MNNYSQSFKIKLGVFVLVGVVIFVLAIFIIGKQKNMFNPVYPLKATFSNVSGLQIGNTVRFAGINIGTVDNIVIINDTTVQVDLLIQDEIKKFIKSDSKASIGSDGIVGDKLLVISHGTPGAEIAKDGAVLLSVEPIETTVIMASLSATAKNAQVISGEMVQIMKNINNQKGIIGRLIKDSTFSNNINKTIMNLKSGTKKLDENMDAAKNNVLLRGYFKKQEKEKEKAREEKEKEKAEKEKAKEEAKKAKEEAKHTKEAEKKETSESDNTKK